MANSAVTIRTLAGASGGSSDGMSIRKNVVQANSFVPGDAVYVDSLVYIKRQLPPLLPPEALLVS